MFATRHLTFLGILLVARPLAAQPDVNAEIAAIRSELSALMQRLERLEQSRGQSQAAVAAAAPAEVTVADVAAPAVPPLRFFGDFRYRHESIDEDAVAERHRHRVRARFGVAADVGEKVTVGLGLATGGDDPVSANQTLDGGFTRKPFGVDRAFFTWRATEDLSFTGGKMANPFFRPGNHHLIYDNDLNPEGLAVRYDAGNWFANYAGLWVEERSADNDSILLGGQVGFRHRFAGGPELITGVSYYDYLQTDGQTPFFDGTAAGNRLGPAGGYANDFNSAELFAQLDLRAFERPLVIFGDYVRNTEADSANRGWALGLALGAVTAPGTWRLGYAYQDLEADAVIGTFTDSDFGGGGTDNGGHVVEFAYGFRSRLSFGLRYFLTERGRDAGDEHGYKRLQADVMFTY